MFHFRPLFIGLIAVMALKACTQGPEVTTPPQRAEYLGIKTMLLDGELVNFHVAMRGTTQGQDVESYARCAAAQYALIRGAGFVRHIRTTLTRSGSIWQGDAVYVVSAALPKGSHTIDAEVTVRDCGELRIPTV